MGNTLKEIGRNDEAADSFKKVIKHTPENLFVAYSLSNLDENFLVLYILGAAVQSFGAFSSKGLLLVL